MVSISDGAGESLLHLDDMTVKRYVRGLKTDDMPLFFMMISCNRELSRWLNFLCLMVENSLRYGFSTKLTWIFILCLKNFQPSGREFLIVTCT